MRKGALKKNVQVQEAYFSGVTSHRNFETKTTTNLSGKLSERVENAVGKGEIACYKVFLFPQNFRKTFVQQTPKIKGLFRRGLILSQTSPDFYMSTVKTLENTVQKVEIAHKKQFLLFPQCFLSFWRGFCHIHYS